MIVGTRGSVLRLLQWQWRFMVLAATTSVTVVVLHEVVGWKWLVLPSLPLAVVGAALGIFVSFRTNSAYDRWWEGRKLWGRMINTSRHMGSQCIQLFPSSQTEQTEVCVRRHIAYTHTLRSMLRNEDPLQDENVLKYLSDEEKKALVGSSNATTRLLDWQLRDFVKLADEEEIDPFRLRDLNDTVRHLLDIQGGCERIKKTPLPKIYGFFSERMIQVFSSLMPCALVDDLGWIAVPISMLVAFGFKMISETGRVLEDPFTTFWNGLPLSTISRMIEINLLEMLGQEELPESWPPLNDFVIM